MKKTKTMKVKTGIKGGALFNGGLFKMVKPAKLTRTIIGI